MSLYQAINVWKRISDVEAICYRCFKNLETNRYSVQSADFFRLPLDGKQVVESEQQYLELLIEEAPDSRSASFHSVIEAIKTHEAEFGRLPNR